MDPAGDRITKSFSRNMTAYKHGFGSVDAEHWLGNDKLHHLTNQRVYELRLDSGSFFSGRRASYAHYRQFAISNETRNYTLSANGYSGVAGTMYTNYHHHNNNYNKDNYDNKKYDDDNEGRNIDYGRDGGGGMGGGGRVIWVGENKGYEGGGTERIGTWEHREHSHISNAYVPY